MILTSKHGPVVNITLATGEQYAVTFVDDVAEVDEQVGVHLLGFPDYFRLDTPDPDPEPTVATEDATPAPEPVVTPVSARERRKTRAPRGGA